MKTLTRLGYRLHEGRGQVLLVVFVLGLLQGTVSYVLLVIPIVLCAVGRSLRLAALLLLVFFAGFQLSEWRVGSRETSDINQLIGKNSSLKGTLTEHFRSTSSGSYVATVALSDGPIEGSKIWLSVVNLGESVNASIGSEVAFRGKLMSLKKRERYLWVRGVSAKVFAQEVSLTGRSRRGIGGLVDAVRARSEETLGSGLGEQEGALARGMVLGQDDGLSNQVHDEFRAAGLTHLVAASGQNILLLVGFLMPLFRVVGLRRGFRVILLLLAIALYVPLAGGGPSIQRAGVMGAIGCIGLLVGRKPLRWYSLLVGAAVTLLLNPYAYEDVGWQLSFAAVAGIFLLSEPVARFTGRVLPKWMAEPLGVTLAASVATAPMLLASFGQFSWVSVPANLAVAPAVAPVMFLGAAALVLGVFDTRLAALVNAIAQFPLAYIQSVAHVAALLVATPVPLIGADLPDPPRQPTVSFLAVGQGDATLFQADGKTVLVDTGPPGGPIVKELKRSGVRSIDLLVLTHPQSDHEGEAVNLLDNFSVGTVLDGGYGAEAKEHDEIISAISRHNVSRRIPRDGEMLSVGGISLSILWPTPEAVESASDPNDRAVVAIAKLGRLSVLMTADAESEITHALDLEDVDILKVAHHGSDDQGLPDLLRRIRPGSAVIEVGKQNSYGHPAASTLAALRSVPHTYRTDRDGTVRFVAN